MSTIRIYILFLVCLLLGLKTANANSLVVFGADDSDYPVMKAKVFALDNNGAPLTNLTAADFRITEDGLPMNIRQYNCPPPINSPKMSAVITVDISSSMADSRIALVQSALTEWIPKLTSSDFECAITGFNTKNYLFQDFTKDNSKLLESIQSFNTIGGANFNTAFLEQPAGALITVEKSQYQPFIVLITDGSSSGDEFEIVQKALMLNAKVYCITLGLNSPQILKNISIKTGGVYFENITTENELTKAFLSIFNVSRGVQPCEILWTSWGCIKLRTAQIELTSSGLKDSVKFSVTEDLLPHFEYGKPPFINFGVRDVGEEVFENITITARNADLEIFGFQTTNSQFTISDWGGSEPDFTLKRDSSRIITIKFQPLHKDYNYARIEITGSSCANNKIYVSGGAGDAPPPDNSLRVESPNGGEVFSAKLDTVLTWSGVLPSDTVRIEYSTNSGTDWKLISDSAAGLKHKWIPPDISSEKCMLRVLQLSDRSNFNKVKILKGHIGKVYTGAWSPDGTKIVSGSDDGTVRIWNALTGNELTILENDLISVLSLDWSSNGRYIAGAVAGGNPIIWDAENLTHFKELEADGKLINQIKFDNSGDYIAAACDDGWIYIWKNLNAVPVHKFKPFAKAATSIAWKISSMVFAATSSDGSVNLYNAETGEKVSELPKYDCSIQSAGWNVDGSHLVVAGDTSVIDIWNLNNFENPDRVSFINIGHVHVKRVNYSPDRKYVATVCSDSTVKLWHTHNNRLFYSYRGHLSDISELNWNHNGNFAVTSSFDYTLQVWSPLDIPFEKQPIQSDVSDNLWRIAQPKIEIAEVDFGTVAVGTSHEKDINNFIVNIGECLIRIDSVKISNSTQFGLKNNIENVYLQPGARIGEVPEFKEVIEGISEAEINVFTHFGLKKSIIKGYGVKPSIAAMSDFIDFGLVNAGDTSILELSALKNESLLDVVIDSVVSKGPGIAEFFIDEPLGSFAIPSGNEKILKLGFSPSDSGRISGSLAFYYDGFGSPAILNLFGQGVLPVIQSDSAVVFDTVLCANDITSADIEIKNTGSGYLRIYAGTVTGDNAADFKVTNPIFPIVIPSGSASFISLEFSPAAYGNRAAKLVLETNRMPSLRNYEINLKGYKDSVAFELSPEILAFGNVPSGQESRRNAIITNTGYTDIYWASPIDKPLFVIENISPAVTMPGASSTVTVLFKGTTAAGSYNDSFLFRDTCGAEIALNVSAFVGSTFAEIEALDKIVFPNQVCEISPKDTIINIKNTGNSDLLIFSAAMKGRDLLQFAFVDNLTGKSIQPNESLQTVVTFEPESTGVFEAILEITSNAANSNGGVWEIALSGNKDNSSFALSASELDFGNVQENIPKLASFDITNTGTIPIQWSISENSDKFKIVSVIPERASAGESSNVIAEFSGASEGVYSHTFTITDSCGSEQLLVCSAKVSTPPYFIVYSENANANTGEITDIKIKISNPKNVSLDGITALKARLRFNSTLLAPADGEQRGTAAYPHRFYDFTFPMIITADSVLVNLKMIATLGNSDTTELLLENAEFIGDNPSELRVKSGVFRLLDVCYFGGARLIGNTGRFYLDEVVPSPVVDVSTVKFGIIEKGESELAVYDLFGRKVMHLFKQFTEPGLYSSEIPAAPLPTGSYILELKTASEVLYRKFTIMK